MGGGTPSLKTGGGGTSLGEAVGMGIRIGREGRDDPGTGTPPEGVLRVGMPLEGVLRVGTPEGVLRVGTPAEGVCGTGRGAAPVPCWGTMTAGVPTSVGAAAEPRCGRGCAPGVPVGGPWGGVDAAGGVPAGAELPGSLAPGCWNISMVFLAPAAGPSDLPVSGQNVVPSAWSLPQ